MAAAAAAAALLAAALLAAVGAATAVLAHGRMQHGVGGDDGESEPCLLLLPPNRSKNLACLERLPSDAAETMNAVLHVHAGWYVGQCTGIDVCWWVMVGWGTACLLGRRSGGWLAYEAGAECVAYLLASLLTSTCVTLTLT
jgi:hypothetical protein